MKQETLEKTFLCKNDKVTCIIQIIKKNDNEVIIATTKITDLSDFKFPKE